MALPHPNGPASLLGLRRLAKRVPGARAFVLWLKKKKLETDFKRDFAEFKKLAGGTTPRFPLEWKSRLPMLEEKGGTTDFDRHYIYHPAWAARILARTRPSVHVDISSILHFASLVSAFFPVRFYDYRPADLCLTNLECDRADLSALPFKDCSIESLSCMHVVEHIGLGRYGDPLDPDGDIKAMRELTRVLSAGGSLLFVVPLGKPKICFNAHRIYSYDQVMCGFSELKLEEFSLIPDDPQAGGLIQNATREMSDAQAYGCGCFWFRRKN
jgi:SAM-dependent methyltransferase